MVGEGASGAFDYVIASESVALDVLDFDLETDIKPGEAIFIPCG
jgi:amidophosphoribosyltransferase